MDRLSTPINSLLYVGQACMWAYVHVRMCLYDLIWSYHINQGVIDCYSFYQHGRPTLGRIY